MSLLFVLRGDLFSQSRISVRSTPVTRDRASRYQKAPYAGTVNFVMRNMVSTKKRWVSNMDASDEESLRDNFHKVPWPQTDAWNSMSWSSFLQSIRRRVIVFLWWHNQQMCALSCALIPAHVSSTATQWHNRTLLLGASIE